MSEDKFYEIFEELIGQHLRNSIIFKHEPKKGTHTYEPFRHHFDTESEKRLGNFMRKYIFYYAYSETEVIKAYEKGRLNDLEKAATIALDTRLPKRKGAGNGLYSELLLDLLITMFSNNVNKLATRAVYRQDTDNQELKGYDGLHISVDEDDNKFLWLGQAKMGSRSYCVTDIKKDLTDKANMLYTAKQLFFVSDKETKTLPKAIDVLEKINQVYWDNEDLSPETRADSLSEFFKNERIKIVFPCLLAYGMPSFYEVEGNLESELETELEKIIDQFDEKFETLLQNEYEILVWFIPIRDLKALRESMGLLDEH
ncbi:Hachiman antiphage defense system protein HamA [Rossellomorea sp. GAMAL-10_SWC]